MLQVPESFLERLFAVSKDPEVISLAGGLPSSAAIDRAGLARAAAEVLEEDGSAALQYSTTEVFSSPGISFPRVTRSKGSG